MSDKYLHVGHIAEQWSASGSRILKYTLEISHTGLNEHKIISAPDIIMLKTKTEMQLQKWHDKWEIIQNKKQVQENKLSNAHEAEKQTRLAQDKIKELVSLLIHTLDINDTINWELLKVRQEFPEAMPIRPAKPIKLPNPPRPDRSSPEFNPPFKLIEKIIPSLKLKRIALSDESYRNAVDLWTHKIGEIDEINRKNEKEDKLALQRWEKSCEDWEACKKKFLAKQDEFNASIDLLANKYMGCDTNAIEQYCEMVLNNSSYPDYFPKEFELLYNPENKILLCEYYFFSPDSMPRIKEVKYVASKNELHETTLSDSQIEKLYDSMIYQVTLRSCHEVFEADAANAVDAFSFNGHVRHINKATGKEEDACIVSIQVKKSDFLSIDLKNVDPKTCFKSLKGIGSSKLHGITPVKPIMQIDKTDRRFVEAYDVADSLDETTNIAAMDWEDFEHLIRELFEMEFSKDGGEVKITQASRDGGVDAIAFDPDPIRGGKIVIQAKRYTNTVGVSAVRDLYGTVVNEGATKGILVTTADYGPDAYDFAKNKPITLLNGGNLLHLLEKHGHNVKIDIKEAKKILEERS